MFSLAPCQRTEVFFARIRMQVPRSRSSGFGIHHTLGDDLILTKGTGLDGASGRQSVVLPWSTWAIDRLMFAEFHSL